MSTAFSIDINVWLAEVKNMYRVKKISLRACGLWNKKYVSDIQN